MTEASCHDNMTLECSCKKFEHDSKSNDRLGSSQKVKMRSDSHLKVLDVALYCYRKLFNNTRASAIDTRSLKLPRHLRLPITMNSWEAATYCRRVCAVPVRLQNSPNRVLSAPYDSVGASTNFVSEKIQWRDVKSATNRGKNMPTSYHNGTSREHFINDNFLKNKRGLTEKTTIHKNTRHYVHREQKTVILPHVNDVLNGPELTTKNKTISLPKNIINKRVKLNCYEKACKKSRKKSSVERPDQRRKLFLSVEKTNQQSSVKRQDKPTKILSSIENTNQLTKLHLFPMSKCGETVSSFVPFSITKYRPAKNDSITNYYNGYIKTGESNITTGQLEMRIKILKNMNHNNSIIQSRLHLNNKDIFDAQKVRDTDKQSEFCGLAHRRDNADKMVYTNEQDKEVYGQSNEDICNRKIVTRGQQATSCEKHVQGDLSRHIQILNQANHNEHESCLSHLHLILPSASPQTTNSILQSPLAVTSYSSQASISELSMILPHRSIRPSPQLLLTSTSQPIACSITTKRNNKIENAPLLKTDHQLDFSTLEAVGMSHSYINNQLTTESKCEGEGESDKGTINKRNEGDRGVIKKQLAKNRSCSIVKKQLYNDDQLVIKGYNLANYTESNTNQLSPGNNNSVLNKINLRPKKASLNSKTKSAKDKEANEQIAMAKMTSFQKNDNTLIRQFYKASLHNALVGYKYYNRYARTKFLPDQS